MGVLDGNKDKAGEKDGGQPGSREDRNPFIRHLRWAGGLLPGRTIRGGRLSGKFDTQGQVSGLEDVSLNLDCPSYPSVTFGPGNTILAPSRCSRHAAASRATAVR